MAVKKDVLQVPWCLTSNTLFSPRNVSVTLWTWASLSLSLTHRVIPDLFLISMQVWENSCHGGTAVQWSYLLNLRISDSPKTAVKQHYPKLPPNLVQWCESGERHKTPTSTKTLIVRYIVKTGAIRNVHTAGIHTHIVHLLSFQHL